MSAVADLDWARIASDLDAFGCAATGPLLDAPSCAALRDLYADASRFRSRVVTGERYTAGIIFHDAA